MNTGDRFGCLLILELGHKKEYKSVTLKACKVKCDCGKILIKSNQAIKRDKNQVCSFGCPNRKNKPLNLKIKKTDFQVLKGEKYGYLEIINNPFYREAKVNSKGRIVRFRQQVAKCKCLLCGRIRIVICQNIKRNKSKSCGVCSYIPDEYKNISLKEKKKCETCLKTKGKIFFSFRKESFDKLAHSCRECSKNKYTEKKIIPNYEYKKIFKKQNGGCAICGASATNKKIKMLSVDHCHKSGKVRGLLCANCNLGLGSMKDSISNLEKAIIYLKENS